MILIRQVHKNNLNKKHFSYNILIDYLQVREGFHLGTHSLQKGSATYASCCGISRDFVNKRGQ